MAGIKIINVLKHDTLADIVDAARQAPQGEIILVLPRTGKAFSSEEHFSTLASELDGLGKTLSVLSSDPLANQWARKVGFTVMNAGQKPLKPRKKPAAALASQPPPAADDIVDPNEDAFDTESRNVVTSDETMGGSAADTDLEGETLEGFHVVGESDDKDGDGIPDEPAADEVSADDAELARATDSAPLATLASHDTHSRRMQAANIPITVHRAVGPAPAQPPRPSARPSPVLQDLDYIDAVWRDKAASASRGTEAGSSWTKLFARTPKAAPEPMRTSKRLVWGLSLAALVVLMAAIYLTTGSALVLLKPAASQLDTEIDVQVSDAFSAVDSAFGKVPGQLLTVTRTASATVAASGQRDVASKARGRLTVSNEYSSTPQTLVATTRFASPDGLVFRSLQTVTVPGSTVQAGKTVPGTVDVDVVADKPGPSYNVAAGKFTIVAFTEKGDTERSQRIYGISTDAMTGGASGPSKVVAQADYDKALDDATIEVQKQISDALREQASGMRVVDEIKAVIDKTETSARPDDAADEVKVSVTASLKTVAFKQVDLERLIIESVMKTSRLVVVPDQLGLSFKEIQFMGDTGILAFTLALVGPAYAPLDVDSIVKDIQGMDSRGIHEYFAAKEGVESASVELKPFWVRRVPSRPDRVHLTVQHVPPAPSGGN